MSMTILQIDTEKLAKRARGPVGARSVLEHLTLLLALALAAAAGAARADIVPLAAARGIAVGGAHACAVGEDGSLVCWGENGSGQIGDGSNITREFATPVLGMESDVAAVTAGDRHSCALMSTGAVLCWGENARGQLGNGGTASRVTPVPVSGLASGIVAIAAGAEHTCALRSSGGMTCWGSNSIGQLGNIGAPNRPVDVLDLTSGVAAIAVGAQHSCAVLASGGMKCWGYNSDGQLGDGSTAPQEFPVNVQGLGSPIRSAAAGQNHTCALTTAGGLKCWGSNSFGQLGTGIAGAPGRAPIDVAGLTSGVRSVTAGPLNTCALTLGGKALCWGDNAQGQLGTGGLGASVSPAEVRGLENGTRSLALNGAERCAGPEGSQECRRLDRACSIAAEGEVRCWGAGYFRQLGNGGGTRVFPNRADETFALAALRLALPEPAADVAVGGDHSCALSVGGAVFCWGGNQRNQLGSGGGEGGVYPVPVPGVASGARGIALGAEHSCAITGSGTVQCWGGNSFGQLGDGTLTARAAPAIVSGLDQVVAIGAGSYHTCALSAGGTIKCWGDNRYGQLGDGTNTTRLEPTALLGLGDRVTSLAVGSSHTCAVAGGAVWCWGYNRNGAIGDGSDSARNVPTATLFLTNGATAVAAGGGHSCALQNGNMRCWGYNGNGQLGDGSVESRYAPVAVLGLPPGLTALTAGDSHTCALTAGGRAKCWGRGTDGRLGYGAETDQREPVVVENLAAGSRKIVSQRAHTCALDSAGSIACWGENSSGQIGTATYASTSPVAVLAQMAAPASIAVTEFYHAALKHYFRTGSGAEAAAIDGGAAGQGWNRTGDDFPAYPNAARGTQGVCRFYGSPGRGPNSHFYTISPSECAAVKTDPGWTYEEIAFHAFPPGPTGQCDGEDRAIYRLYNGRWQENDSNHRYTPSAATYQQMQGAGWAGEGVVMCVPRQ